jgi:hypothetical protein
MGRDVLTVLFDDPFAVMNTIGLIGFAFVGLSRAIRR